MPFKPTRVPRYLIMEDQRRPPPMRRIVLFTLALLLLSFVALVLIRGAA